MLRVLITLIVLVHCKGSVFSQTCYFSNFDPKNAPIFLEEFDNNSFIIPISEEIEIQDNSKVLMICEGGLRSNSNKETGNTKNIYCSNGVVTVDRDSDSYDSDEYVSYGYKNTQYSCHYENFVIYDHNMKSCSQKSGALFTTKIQNAILSHVEYCLDASKLNLEFLHYVSAKRNRNLNDLIDLSVTSPATQMIPTKNLFLRRFILSDADINNFMEQERELFSNAIKFSMTNLAPIEEFGLEFLINLQQKVEILGRVIMWDGLKYGNWMVFEKSLSEHSVKLPYDVYAGIFEALEVVKVAGCGKNKTFTITNGFISRNIPRYIWKYLLPRSRNSSEEVVVIGVNSPFVTTNLTEFVFCNDICSSFPWLIDLEYSKNMPVLGIMFCCDPQEVGQKYESFQQILNSLNHEKEENRTIRVPIEEQAQNMTSTKTTSPFSNLNEDDYNYKFGAIVS